MTSTKQIDLADFTQRLDYVGLGDAGQTILIGRIAEIAVNKSYIVVYDDRTNKLFLFDSKGAFLRVLMTKGRGPNEFVGINSIDINENNEILVYKDGFQIAFLNPDGTSNGQIKLSNSPAVARWLNDKIILLVYPFPKYILNGGYEVSFLDRYGKVLKSALPSPIKNIDYNDWMPSLNCERNKDTIYYWNEYRDTVYGITMDMKLAPRAILKHSRQRYPIEEIKRNAKIKGNFSTDNGYVQNTYREYKDKVLISLTYKRASAKLLVDRASGLGHNIFWDYGDEHFKGFKNNLDGGLEFWPTHVTNNGDLIMIVDPNELRETFIKHQKSKIPVKYPDIQDSVKLNIVDKISLMDNPIIVIIENFNL